MATATVAPPITVEQYLAFEGYPGLRDELIKGRIVLSPQPKPLHQYVAQHVYNLLREAFKESLYTVGLSSNIRFDLAHSMPAPDVFVVTKTALSAAIANDAYLSEPPLLAIEVISPANSRRNVIDKTELYLSHGTKLVWTIYPKKKRVDVFAWDARVIEVPHTGTLPLPQPANTSIAVGDLLNYSLSV
ncbi:MAG: Uma2 family endonuclease [Acidobacteriaceae bacterium]|nr:Uma2 family endonuclease [Acidobacteriaceae bacterium]